MILPSLEHKVALGDRIYFVALIQGDITEKLKANGTQCPYELVDGNTQVIIESSTGRAGAGENLGKILTMFRPVMETEFKALGTIVGDIKWFYESADSVPDTWTN